jgi:striatin 1/3/4
MGSFIKKRDSGVCEVPTSASWIPSYPNMLVVSYRNPLFSIFDKVTGRSKGSVALEVDTSLPLINQQINKIIAHPSMPLSITGHENKQIKLFDLNSMR